MYHLPSGKTLDTKQRIIVGRLFDAIIFALIYVALAVVTLVGLYVLGFMITIAALSLGL